MPRAKLEDAVAGVERQLGGKTLSAVGIQPGK